MRSAMMHAAALAFAVGATVVVPASAFTTAGSGIATNAGKLHSTLPADFDVVAAGGWNTVEKLSADPKAELVALIKDNISASDGKVKQQSDDGNNSSSSDGKLDALVALLQSQGKGFDADLIDGKWTAVLSRQGKKSPKIQKLVSSKSRVNKAYANFNVDAQVFENESYTPHGRGALRATVKYSPTGDGYDIGPDGGIVLRRIMCDIDKASFKYWKLPKLPLPLRAKGGYLDVLYLDEDMRITRGNRGGIFIHFRRDFLNEVTKPASFQQALLEEKIKQDHVKKRWWRRLLRK